MLPDLGGTRPSPPFIWIRPEQYTGINDRWAPVLLQLVPRSSFYNMNAFGPSRERDPGKELCRRSARAWPKRQARQRDVHLREGRGVQVLCTIHPGMTRKVVVKPAGRAWSPQPR